MNAPNYLEETFFFTIDYHGRTTTEQLIDSIADLEIVLNIIVNDNEVADYQVPPSSSLQIVVHRAGKNLGFAAACNLALRLCAQTHCRFLFHINNDVRFSPQPALELFLRILDSHRNFVMLSPVVLDRSGTVEYAGSSLLASLSTAIIHSRQPATGFDVPVAALFIDGACFALVPSRLQETGASGFDENYFAYREEHDLAFRIRQAGFNVGCLGSLTVTHDTSSTFKRYGRLKSFLLVRNQIYFARKNLALGARLVFFSIFGAKTCARLLISILTLDRESITGMLLGFKNQLLRIPIEFYMHDEQLMFMREAAFSEQSTRE